MRQDHAVFMGELVVKAAARGEGRDEVRNRFSPGFFFTSVAKIMPSLNMML